MPDGGVFAIHIPKAPYRCPPAPYERACLVARYFAARKRRSKVLILDANDDVQAEKALFKAAWEGRYQGLVEYRPDSELVDVDVATLTARLVFDDVAADVLNVIPPQCAGAIARQLGMANANDRFCQVDFLSYESTAQKSIHVLGDSIQPAELMPRSGHTASRQAKVCAAAVVALLTGGEVNPVPVVASACYSFIDDKEAAHLCFASPLRSGTRDDAHRAGEQRCLRAERAGGGRRGCVGAQHLGGHVDLGPVNAMATDTASFEASLEIINPTVSIVFVSRTLTGLWNRFPTELEPRRR